MQVTNQRQIDFEVQKMNDIKPYNRNTNEFSKITYACITVSAFSMMVFLVIKIFL